MQAGALVRVIKVQIIAFIHELSSTLSLSSSSQIILNSSAAYKSQENGSKLIKFESSFVWPASPASGH